MSRRRHSKNDDQSISGARGQRSDRMRLTFNVKNFSVASFLWRRTWHESAMWPYALGSLIDPGVVLNRLGLRGRLQCVAKRESWEVTRSTLSASRMSVLVSAKARVGSLRFRPPSMSTAGKCAALRKSQCCKSEDRKPNDRKVPYLSSSSVVQRMSVVTINASSAICIRR